jgi:hypothetical protein
MIRLSRQFIRSVFNLKMLCACLAFAAVHSLNAVPFKPRLVVLTDIAPGNVEPDDRESRVRLPAWRVKQERTPGQCKAFLHQFRFYTICDQDVPFPQRYSD